MVKLIAEIEVLKHQSEFANSMEKFTAIVGGLGSGKSRADVFRSLNLLKIRKKALIALYAPTYRDLIDTNIPDFEEIFQQYRIGYRYKKSERKIIVNSGVFKGEIWFRSADKPGGIVGYDATDSIIDEYDILPVQKQRDLWVKMLGRMRGVENSTVGVSTTSEGFKRTYDLFETQKVGRLIKAKTTDNPFLPQDYIDTLYAQYDEQLQRQYINAEWLNVNGRQAYYGFNRDVNHVSNYDFEKKYDIRISELSSYNIGMDFNVDKMCAEVFIHIPEKKRIHFFDEIVLKHLGYSDETQTQRMCDEIKRRYSNQTISVYPDASGNSNKTSAPKSDIAILTSNKFRVYANRANPSVRDRLTSTNNMLGKGLVTMDKNKCSVLVEDFEKCTTDKYGELDKKDPELTHASDGGTYPIVYMYPMRKSVVIDGEVSFA